MLPKAQQPVRIPPDLLARADALIDRVPGELLSYTRPSRAAIVRVALARGLDSLEAEAAREPEGER